VTALVRSELLKVRTVRSWWAYLIVIVLLAGLFTVAELGPDGQPLDSVEFQLSLLDAAGIAPLIAIILGITVVTGEFRHGTITPTSLVEPRRERVLAAKALTSGFVGAGFALLALAVIALVMGVWLSLVDAEVHLLEGEVLTRGSQVVLLTVLWALLGPSIGSVVHSQVAALVGTLVWIFLVELALLPGVLGLFDAEGAAAYLPFHALDAADGVGGDDLLSYWGGVAVALAWIAALGTAGLVRTRRRDLT
jgi:ABC-2 type transport system permease protein